MIWLGVLVGIFLVITTVALLWGAIAAGGIMLGFALIGKAIVGDQGEGWS